jgi:sigma-B regulation protein RsbU (phosphoserine phosphatase)
MKLVVIGASTEIRKMTIESGFLSFRSIRTKFLALVVPLVLLSTFAVFGLFELNARRDANLKLEEKLQKMITLQSSVISEPLWNVSDEQIELNLAALAIDPDVLGVAVYDVDGILIGKSGSVEEIGRQRFRAHKDINYTYKNELQTIGRISIALTDSSLRSAAQERITLTAILAAVLLVSVVFSALVGNRRTIGIPLQRLLRSINQSRHAHDRQPVDWRSNDEIGEVVSAFNEMQEQQATYERELEEARDNLERRVEERTAELDDALKIQENQNTLLADQNNELAQIQEKLQAAYDVIKVQKERMETELNVAHEIQMSMVPLIFPAFPDYDEFTVFAALEPAREVGGDFYDFYFIDEDRFCICIGDVSGKGVPAALFMAVAKTLIKSRATDDFSTASILTHVNDELSANNKESMFVTLFIAIVNIVSGKVDYTNAGHNPPYISRKNGKLQCLDARHGPVVGAMEGMVYGEDRVELAPDDFIFLYTDGVTEAMDARNTMFSDERLAGLLEAMDGVTAEKAVNDTVVAVKAFEGESEQTDDITVLAFQYHGSSEASGMAELQVAIKNELSEIARMHEVFEAFADEHGIPMPVTMKFNLVFDELLSNVISYAYRDEDEHEISTHIEFVSGRLTVTISDDGVPFNPLNAKRPDTQASLEDRDIGGLGIHLVRNLVDNVSYHRGIDKNVLTLVKQLDSEDV